MALQLEPKHELKSVFFRLLALHLHSMPKNSIKTQPRTFVSINETLKTTGNSELFVIFLFPPQINPTNKFHSTFIKILAKQYSQNFLKYLHTRIFRQLLDHNVDELFF